MTRPARILLALALAMALLPAGRASAQMVSRLVVTLGDKTVALDGAGYQRGNAAADVWVVEFADFGCGYCEKFFRETQPVFDSLYINKGKVFWKFVPFTIGMFPNSGHAAEASICAAEQGKFFPMHDVLYDKRKEWMKASNPRGQMSAYAQQVRLDMARFGSCMKGKAVGEQLAKNNALARSLFVRGTPTFFINGEVVPGALPTDVFVRGMDAVIKEYSGRGSRR
jgi:protein-disulfide isomerase